MAVNSKKKGNRGERKIVEMLNNHFDTKEFARVPASGAISTIHKLSKNSIKSYCGDIVTPDNFRFSVENKYGYEVDLYNLFQEDNGDKRKIQDFIDQAIKDSSKVSGIEPMVIYTRTRKKPLVAIRKLVLTTDLLNSLNQYIVFKYKKEEWIVSDLNEILRNFPKEFFFLDNCEKENAN